MKKVLVIGSGGAGKSTFAQRLGASLGIKVIHLDTYYWKAGWVETPKAEWQSIVKDLLQAESWIMDGNYSGTMEMRLAACDTIIFLDLPRWLCLWRVLKRAVRYRNERRPDMAEGCLEKLDWEFLLWVWSYPKRTRPKIIALLKKQGRGKQIIRLRTGQAIKTFLAQV